MTSRSRKGTFRRSAGCGTPRGQPASLDDIVRFYRRDYDPKFEAQLASFRDEPTVRAAVQRAALARDPAGRKYKHQRRLSEATFEAVLDSISRVRFERCRTFDDLHDLVHARIAPIPGVGDLMIYDTALRIGARLKLTPTTVYLHRGARDGARALGLNWHASRLQMKELPAALRRLEPHQVENLLCVFARAFDGLDATPPRSAARAGARMPPVVHAAPNSLLKPSQVVDDYWIYARRVVGAYPARTERSGKWLVFVPIPQLDEVWATIRAATADGRLGEASKVATMRPNPNAANRATKVICVYTYDFEDVDDARRIRQELRKLGIHQKIPYKADHDTLAGKYVIEGHTHISKYFE